NTAARVQDLTKGTRHMLLFTQATRDCLSQAPPDLVDVGAFAIRGRQQSLTLLSLENISDPPIPDQDAASSGPERTVQWGGPKPTPPPRGLRHGERKLDAGVWAVTRLPEVPSYRPSLPGRPSSPAQYGSRLPAFARPRLTM